MSERRKPYPFDEIEPRWQTRWDEGGEFVAPNPGDAGFDPRKPKYYVLDMFPYPSGAGLHVGHPEGYTATDIIARYKRLRGCNVLHPMGWDAFGLPAEQYAIRTGQHPAITTRENVAKFKTQLKRIGFSYDWSREISTTDPRYFRWTQWIFLQIYDSWFNPETRRAEPISTYRGADADAVRLAYVAEVPVNWCPELGTVLANEEVIDGKSEVGGFPVVRRPMRQWMLRITAYAERLIDELEGLDWPEGIKLLQRNWIGRSEGAEVSFAIAARGTANADCSIRVFTTRPDTLYGATYMVLAPENPLVDQLVTPEQAAAVAEYRQRVAAKSDLERTDLAKEKTGVFTGAYAVNPVSGEQVPVWIADYVVMGYGTGAIMAVPAHDERDFEFAQQFGLPVRKVVSRGIGSEPSGSGDDRLEVDSTTAATGFRGMDPHEELLVRRGSHLPHWTQDGATYAVNFRLVDSLPETVLQEWQHERRELSRIAAERGEALPAPEQARLDAAFSEKVEAYLDAGRGECWLRDPRIAELIRDALLHFDGDRYELAAWCVMPNHVHVIVQPKAGHQLSDILHSWKSFTASRANQLLERDGAFWQAESYDRLIRTEEGLRRQIRYAWENPESAGLGEWPWRGRGIGFQPIGNAGAHPASNRLEADSTCYAGEGFAVNSPLIDGLSTAAAKAKIADWLEERGLGRRTINYKLRDWLFSRQRYWGEPFPIVWRDGKHEALPETDLPLEPPALDDFKPTGTGEPPLAKAKDWLRYSAAAQRETNTMPQWAGSCWYYLRFCDTGNNGRFVGDEAERYWMGGEQPGGVDLYVGGTEHAVLHLLYARFWHKVLFDLGYLSKAEPFQRLVNQGMILGEDGRKMSKRWGNVIDPLDVIAEYGADAFRCYEMFMGPLEQMKPWSMKGVEGVSRFLARVWRLVMEENQAGDWILSPQVEEIEPSKAQLKVLHATIKKVTEDIETLSFNTAISQMMICVNAFTNSPAVPVSAMRTLLVLLNPFAPHITSELWETLRERFGGDSGITAQAWPVYDERLLIEDDVEIPIQVNGKLRDKIVVALEASAPEIEAAALASPKVQEFTAGKTVRRVVVVPKKLVNIVAN
ncbi:MAG: class I tRNA ligase family protein [Verrucomicrobiota bacterium]|nr:class I tRNA ligase family protein [Verrucomicrobiota bacterium]